MTDLLDQLNDITLPAGLGFQLAYGWYLLALAVMICVCAIGFIYRRIHQQKQCKKAAKQLLKNIQNEFTLHQNQKHLAVQCNLLLRRYIKQIQKTVPASQNAFIDL